MKSLTTDFLFCFSSWHNASKQLAQRTHGVGGNASSLQGLNIKYCVCDKLKPRADEGIKLQVCDHNTTWQQREEEQRPHNSEPARNFTMALISHLVLLLENMNTRFWHILVLFVCCFLFLFFLLMMSLSY